MFRIWNEVFCGGPSKSSCGSSNRLVRVVGVQANPRSTTINAPWPAYQVLTWQNAYQEVDALAVAPYFNPNPTEQPTITGYTLDQFFDFLNNTVIPRVITGMTDNATYALSLGLQPITYEGGQHLVELLPSSDPGYAALSDLMNRANRETRMGTAYTRLLNAWRSAGGHLFTHFVNIGAYASGGAGRFGALENLFQMNQQTFRSNSGGSPKFDALMDFITNNSKWW